MQKIYLVGGSVRDLLLGRNPHDRDYVVVGYTQEEFLKEFPTAIKVGNSFPVFLVKGEEYAFARKERKVAQGHKGFVCDFGSDVTLAEDLLRRDLTINAVAMDPETGAIFMAPKALEDFRKRVLRHVSPAFVEDPLRVYRVARFAAQLPAFRVHTETLLLMETLREELRTLSPERVWKETEKALRAPAPFKFFLTLRDAGVLDIHFPELDRLIGVPAGTRGHENEADTFEHALNVLESVCPDTEPDPVLRFAALCHDLGKGLTPPSEWPRHIGHDERGVEAVKSLCKRLRVPKFYQKAACRAARLHMKAHRLLEMRPGKAARLVAELANFPAGGLKGFLNICVADGMKPAVAQEILRRAERSLAVRLPEKYHNLGRKSGEILLRLRAEAWKKAA